MHRTIIAVCCDVCEGYINAAKEVFKGKIPIVIDRFHVAKQYRKCFVTVRKKELARLRKKLTDEQYKLLQPAIRILVKNKGHATSDERRILRKLFYHSPRLKEAFREVPVSMFS